MAKAAQKEKKEN
jgi:hypothetical protein